ncbi:MAG: alpha/beta hydrolase, partial [Burkholderiales bacterium]|nr:alpha/beta hydrolase [Burkholderiales bacterium]
MNYPAPAWLPNGHLQTIYPALCIRKPAVQFRRERWSSPDHDFIDLDFVDGAAEQPCV